MSKLTELHLGKRVQRSLENPLCWENLDGKDYKITKPTVICFGGNNDTNDSRANGYIKNIAVNIGARSGHKTKDLGYGIEQDTIPADFLSVYYNDDTINLTNYEYIASYYNKNRAIDLSEGQKKELKEFEKLIDGFVKQYFSHLFTNENGVRYGNKQACKNFRNLNVVNHCFGAFIFSCIEKNMDMQMTKLGYSKQEIEIILGQIVKIDCAPIVLMGNSKTTSISIISLDDKLPQNYLGGNEEIDIDALNNQVLFREPVEVGEVIYDKNEIVLSFNQLGLESHIFSEYCKLVDENVEKSQRTLGNICGYCMSSILSSSLINSIENHQESKFIELNKKSLLEKTNYYIELASKKSLDEYEELVNEIHIDCSKDVKYGKNGVQIKDKELLDLKNEYDFNIAYNQELHNAIQSLKSKIQKVIDKEKNYIKFIKENCKDREVIEKLHIKKFIPIEMPNDVEKNIGKCGNTNNKQELERRIKILKEENYILKDECDRIHKYGDSILALRKTVHSLVITMCPDKVLKSDFPELVTSECACIRRFMKLIYPDVVPKTNKKSDKHVSNALSEAVTSLKGSGRNPIQDN